MEQIELNIQRVRRLIDFGLTYKDIVTQCSDLDVSDVYLAYKAALILNKE